MLAHLAESGHGRVSPTAHALGAGRRIIGETFLHLAQLGLLERAPGHGHPLRPEFVLSSRGSSVAAWAQEFLVRMSTSDWAAMRRAWALPVLRLVSEPQTFGSLRGQLDPVTDRALSLCLTRLTQPGWVERRVEPAVRPPQVSYLAQGRGLLISSSLQETFSFAR